MTFLCCDGDELGLAAVVVDPGGESEVSEGPGKLSNFV